MSAHLERGRLLLERDRHELAERELRMALAEDPENPFALCLLARAVCELGRVDEATDLAQQAVGAAPDFPFAHQILALVLSEQKRYREALDAIDTAIRLEPEDETLWAVKAHAFIGLKRWKDALQAVESGLEIDAEHEACTHLRGICLQQLGRTDEAAEAAEDALELDPDSGVAHANRGWVYLRQRDHRRAEQHFREALRLDPELDWARQGVVESLKSRNLIYRWMLQYFFWMGTLPSAARWGVIIGIVLLQRLIRSVAQTNPQLAGILIPIAILLFAFVLLTWIADPLFNLFLRLHPFGKLALSKQQRLSSTIVGAVLLGAVVLVGAFLATGELLWGVVAGGCVFYVLPVAATFAVSGGKRLVLGSATALIGLVGIAACACALVGREEPAGSLGYAYFMAIVLFTWFATFVSSRE